MTGVSLIVVLISKVGVSQVVQAVTTDSKVVGIIVVGAQVAGAIHPPRRTRAARVAKILYMFEFPLNVYWSGWYL